MALAQIAPEPRCPSTHGRVDRDQRNGGGLSQAPNVDLALTLLCDPPVIIFKMTPMAEGVMEFISEGCAAITGYLPQDFYRGGVTLARLMVGEDKEALLDERKEKALKEEAYELRYTIRKADGAVIDVVERGCGMLSNGQLVAIEGIIQPAPSSPESSPKPAAPAQAMGIFDAKTAKFLLGNPAFHQLCQECGDTIAEVVAKALVHQEPDEKMVDQRRFQEGRFMVERAKVSDEAILSVTTQAASRVAYPVVESDPYTADLNEIPALIWRADREGHYTSFNKRWLDFTGRSLEDESGDGWMVHVHENDLEAVVAAHVGCFKHHVPFEQIYRLRDRQGAYRWLYEIGTVLRSKQGKIIGFQGHATDVTAMKAIEDELHESEVRTEALAEISPVGIFRTDLDGACFYTNQRWCEMTQLTPEQALGRGWTRSIHGDDREVFRKEWARFAKAGDVFNLEYRILRPDGQDVYVLGQAKPERDSSGAMVGVLGTLTDLTARHRLEQEQLKLSKLESLGVLAGGIAHDFNNQLTPIVLNLAHVLENELDSDMRDRLAEAKRAVDEASHLTRQLLTFAKGGDPVLSVIQLPELLRSSMNFALRGATVCGELAMDTSLWPVKVDRGQISQVIQNLVINACQAMPGTGGKVTIAAENVYAIRHPSLPKIDGRFVHVAITDTGTGISPDNLRRIFDPYFSTKKDGHGLGLASSLSVVLKHHGQLGVDSTVGQGTTFSIYLPACDETPDMNDLSAQETRRVTVDASEDNHPSIKVLVMDDEALIRNATSLLLKKLGHQVVTAKDGSEAIALYRQAQDAGERFDLALMDLTIPGGLGGKETMLELRRIDPDVRAIVFSGYSNDRIMANHRDYGFRAAIHKPFQPEELTSLIRQHAGRRSAA